MTDITAINRYTSRRTRCELVRITKTSIVVKPLEGLHEGREHRLYLRSKGTQTEHFADEYTGFQVFTSPLLFAR